MKSSLTFPRRYIRWSTVIPGPDCVSTVILVVHGKLRMNGLNLPRQDWRAVFSFPTLEDGDTSLVSLTFWFVSSRAQVISQGQCGVWPGWRNRSSEISLKFLSDMMRDQSWQSCGLSIFFFFLEPWPWKVRITRTTDHNYIGLGPYDTDVRLIGFNFALTPVARERRRRWNCARGYSEMIWLSKYSTERTEKNWLTSRLGDYLPK